VTCIIPQDLSLKFSENMCVMAPKLSGHKIGLAVSGGGDSMALLYLMDEWASQNQQKLYVATVDHGLRKESASEAKIVETECKKLNIECKILKWNGWNKVGNLLDAARNARNELIGEWADELRLNSVATGHTADDQAETFLLRLARGSGVDGLSGMAPFGYKKAMLWFRPILAYRRSDLRAFLSYKGIKWVDDPSNEDTRFERIKMRQAQNMLDNLGLTVDRLVETADKMATARSALELLTKRCAENVTSLTILGTVKLDVKAFSLLPLELRYRLIAHVLKWVSGSKYRPRFNSLIESSNRLSIGKDHTLMGCHIISDGIFAEVCREVSKIESIKDFSKPFDNKWVLTNNISYDGLVIGPLGEEGLLQCEGWRKLKFSRISLMGSPAIWKDNVLIAAPMAGLEMNWKCYLTKDYKNFFSMIVTH